ncbi:unnamed protein product [Darwinula stevensoni]|uniref:IST1 homolog n=1 Tax=Darwinula stevensoni TaxID=69355 RepID=A0A7R9A5Y7_9CRUS|nr:unnamed protein product [Darwinula stevensoni]CAG0887584.1 unnamed protein product [Darwinula stevensoni]
MITMFSGAASFGKLKTNLRLAVNRLKLLEKKKTELGLKARKEIADYIAAGKYERAKIRVEHIIREDYLVEAMEILEMYCDLLLARFGLIQQMKGLDDGLQEAISSLIWAAPRLQTDVTELKVISEQLTAKYGKTYAQACRENAVGTVSEKLMHKLGVQAPPKLLVEKYLIEIAKSHNVEYDPDPQVMRDDEAMMGTDALLIDMEGRGHTREEAPPHPPGFVSYPSEPLPPHKPFDYQPGGGEKIPFNPNAFDPSVDAHPMTTAARKAQEAMGTGMSGYPGYGTGGYPVMPPFPDSPPPYSSMPFDVNRPGNHPSTPSNLRKNRLCAQ